MRLLARIMTRLCSTLLDLVLGPLAFPLSMIEFKDLSILCCNIRGALNREAKANVKELVSKLKPTLFCILEPHVQFERVE